MIAKLIKISLAIFIFVLSYEWNAYREVYTCII